MKKLDFWRSDWLLGVVVALVVLVLSGRDLIQSLERKAYDLGVQATSRTPSDKIAVIAIDDQSIANIGRWPWSREVHARMTDLLAGDPVQFFQGSTLLGTGNLALDGGQFRTTLTLPALDVGTYTGFTAVYLPTAEFLGAQSSAVTHVVTPAPLSVTADSLVKPYGTPVPPLTFTTVGLANGDTVQEVLSGALATTATQESVVGSYPISQGSLTLTSGNYTLVFTPGTLTVAPSNLVVTADSLNKVYGSPLPPLTFTYAAPQTKSVAAIADLGGWTLNAQGTSLFDVDGDGAMDLLRLQPSGHSYRRNLGGRFDAARPVAGAAGASLGE